MLRPYAFGLILVAALAAAFATAWPAHVRAAASTPFGGTLWALPGTIQAANFDDGSEGIAYHDTTSGNNGGSYRNTDVDIQPSSEGGYNVGWVAPGEWMNYSVYVAAAGSYTVQLRVASPYGSSMHVGFNMASNVW